MGQLIVPGQPEPEPEPEVERLSLPCTECGESITLSASASKLARTLGRYEVKHEVCPAERDLLKRLTRTFRADVLVREVGVESDAAVQAGEVVTGVLRQVHEVTAARGTEIDVERAALAIVTALSTAGLLTDDASGEVIARGAGEAEGLTFEGSVERLSESLQQSWQRIVEHAPMVDYQAGEPL